MHLSDIQGLVFHAYRRLPHAAYVLLRFGADPHAVRAWLRALVVGDSIDSATPKDVGPDGRPGIRLNVAFTYTGLERLGLSADALSTFPAAFAEGLGQSDDDHRSRVLGDLGDNRPTGWDWGCQDPEQNTAVDVVLMIFATDVMTLGMEVFRWTGAARVFGAIADDDGVEVLLGNLPDKLDEPTSEPFGFTDGISQPVLRGARGLLRADDRQPSRHEIADGEILLGHRDGERRRTLSPTVAIRDDPFSVLPPVKDDVLAADTSKPPTPRHDLGYNGTYLVFRQLEQDVHLFRAETTEYAAQLGISRDRFGAMLVGRWPDGSPLVKCPVAPNPSLGSGPAANDFGFGDDLHGDRCPVGSHIRRANPRDSLTDDPEASWTVTNRHRLLRRGRPYNIGGNQGLYFICLNADIVRQFEFVQQNWIMGDAFEGLEGEDDPVIGARQLRAAAGVMTLPPPPESRVRRQVGGLQQYITVRGGAYFFLPSLTALRYLAGARPATRPPRAEWHPVPAPLTWRERVRFVFLARFPLLLAAVLAALPLLLIAGPALARPMFQVGRPWEAAPVAALASLAASVALLTYRIVELYAAMRVGSRAPVRRALTWARVLRWQSLSLPIVATMVWMSAADATGPRVSELFRFGSRAAAGYAVAFAVLFLAAALRNRSVRPNNSDDGGFLPRSLVLTSLKNRQQPQIPIVSAFFRYVETTAGAWNQDIGTGYIDHEQSRILPGHIAAMVFGLTLLAFYLVGWLVFFPPRLLLRVQLPPMTYLLFELLLGGWVAASAAFFLDRYRVPLLTILLAALVFSASTNTDHQFEIASGNIVSPPSVEDVIRNADKNEQPGDVVPSARPIVVVAAGGGGVHQAAWTARVLTGLTDRWGKQFTGRLRFVSGASAGSVAALHYLNEFHVNQRPQGRVDGGDLTRVVSAAEASATGDVWWGIAYPDLSRALVPLLPGRWLPAQWDRGWALEQSWSRAIGRRSDDKAFTIGAWRHDAVEGWRPAFAFNAMVVETGQRVVLGTHELRNGDPNSVGAIKGVSDVTNCDVDRAGVPLPDKCRDLSLITAARLSASFPFITPFARPKDEGPNQTKKLFHLTDGGYWDNYGIVSVLEWLKAAKPVLQGRRVLVVQIPPSPDPGVASQDQSWVWQLTAPLVALASVRVNAQKARNELEIEQFKESWCAGCIEFVKIPYLSKNRPPETLSWHLSRKERCAIEQSWREYQGSDEALTSVADVLGPPTATDPPLPGECR